MSIKNIEDFLANDGTDLVDDNAAGDVNPEEDNPELGEEEEEGLEPELDDDGNPIEEEDTNTPEGSQEEEKPTEHEVPNVLIRRDGTATDRNGNIVDPTTGKIVARQGAERRLFENNARTTARLNEVETQLTKYKGIAENTNNLYVTLGNSGMTPDQIGGGIDLLVSYHKDPVETTRKILAQTMAMGYNVSQIVGEGTGDAIELSAVSRMLDDRLGRLQPQQHQNVPPVNQEVENRRLLNDFVVSHPGSQIHLQVIGEMVARSNQLGQPISATEAYDRLREHCFNKGLDFSKPLPRAQAGDQRNPDRQPPRNNFPPRRSAKANPGRPIQESALAPATDSWDSIVRSSLRGNK